MTEEYTKCRANTFYLVLSTSSTDKNHIPVFTERGRYKKKKKKKVKDAENLLQTEDELYASMFRIETTDSSNFIKETSWPNLSQ